jgi:peptidoglycan/LPS O-acetylase OafA/YrhL
MSSTIDPQKPPAPSTIDVPGIPLDRSTSSSMAATHAYRPDIDGLRAIAVTSVVLFHAFPRRMAAGFIGVDIFFVISGYLISTIILSGLEQGTFSLGDFYRRRIRRIFPALLVVLVFIALAGWMVLLDDEYRQLGTHIASGTAFIQNFVLWSDSGYFDNDPQTKPLLHLWSLAIEEQYYIFWPLLLMLVGKRRWTFVGMIGPIAVASFGISVYLSYKDPTAAFYSPVSRFWELMTGGFLAYLALHQSDLIGRYRNLASALGVGLLLSALGLINPDRAFPGFWALMPTVGAFLVILAGPHAWINRTFLASRPFVACGLISYPLYLWHWPLLSLAHIVWPENGHATKIAVVLASILLAWMTYRFVEKKVRRHRAPNLSSLLLCGGLAMMLCCGLAIKNGLVSPRINSVNVGSKGVTDFLAARSPDGKIHDGVFTLHNDRHAMTLFIGDSHVYQYAERIYDVEERDPLKNGAIFAVGAGCPPIRNVYNRHFPADTNCWATRHQALEQAADSRITSVVIGGFWSSYFDHKGYYVIDNGNQINLDTLEGRRVAFAELDSEVRKLKAEHKKVYLLLDTPTGVQFDPHAFVTSRGRLERADSSQLQQPVKIDGLQQEIRTELIALAERDHVSTIDPESRLCTKEGCIRMTQTGVAVYREFSHLNPDWIVNHADFIDSTI